MEHLRHFVHILSVLLLLLILRYHLKSSCTLDCLLFYLVQQIQFLVYPWTIAQFVLEHFWWIQNLLHCPHWIHWTTELLRLDIYGIGYPHLAIFVVGDIGVEAEYLEVLNYWSPEGLGNWHISIYLDWSEVNPDMEPSAPAEVDSWGVTVPILEVSHQSSHLVIDKVDVSLWYFVPVEVSDHFVNHHGPIL